MQPQGHLQVACNMIDYGANPQEALDSPRWQWTGGNRILIEEGFPEDTAEELARRGHETLVDASPSSFGRGQVILRDEDGVFWGGTEKRCDGSIAVC